MHSIVSLNLCKEYLNVVMYRIYQFKNSPLFGPTCIFVSLCCLLSSSTRFCSCSSHRYADSGVSTCWSNCHPSAIPGELCAFGSPRRNNDTVFVVAKLEWCGFSMVKKFWRYVYFDRIHEHDLWTWQTHTAQRHSIARQLPDISNQNQIACATAQI